MGIWVGGWCRDLTLTLLCCSPTGYYRPSPTAEYTEDSPGGDFDFFSRLVSSWEAAALIPGSPARGVVVRSGEMGHQLVQGGSALVLGKEEGEGHQVLCLSLLGCCPVQPWL